MYNLILGTVVKLIQNILNKVIIITATLLKTNGQQNILNKVIIITTTLLKTDGQQIKLLLSKL